MGKNKNSKKKQGSAKRKKQELMQKLDQVKLPKEVRDVDLSDRPALLHPSQLRPGQQAKFSLAAQKLQEIASDEDKVEVFETMDALLESVAVAPGAYVQWLTGGPEPSLHKLLALYIAYMRLMGE